jgi:plastocyanin
MRLIAKVFLLGALASTSFLSSAKAADFTVVMNGDYGGSMFFDPVSITVHVGDRVRWTNVITVQHTSTSGTECVPDGHWTTGIMNPGATSAFITFNTAGTFPYFCHFHCAMGMVGEVVVLPAPVPVRATTWGSIKALYAAFTAP